MHLISTPTQRGSPRSSAAIPTNPRRQQKTAYCISIPAARARAGSVCQSVSAGWKSVQPVFEEASTAFEIQIMSAGSRSHEKNPIRPMLNMAPWLNFIEIFLVNFSEQYYL